MRLITAIASLAFLPACASPPAPRNADLKESGEQRAAQLDELMSLMTGSFSSAVQASEDKDYSDIRLHMSEIRPGTNRSDKSTARWLYVEQAAASTLDKPYRQRVYRVIAKDDGSFVSEVYTLPGDALAWVGAWRTPAKFASLTPDQLMLKGGCAVLLQRNARNDFRGGTQGNTCPSERAGAAYATSEVLINEYSLTTWDRGYDSAGKQVWGATKGPYRFDRVRE